MRHPRGTCHEGARVSELAPGQFGYLEIRELVHDQFGQTLVNPEAPLHILHGPYEELKLSRDNRGRWIATFIPGEMRSQVASRVPRRGAIFVELRVSTAGRLRFTDLIDPLTVSTKVTTGDQHGWVDGSDVLQSPKVLKASVPSTTRVYRESAPDRLKAQFGKRGLLVRVGFLDGWQPIAITEPS